jgi:hypothetical protein
VAPRQVQRYITELEDAGYIARIKRFSGKKAQLNSFAGLIKKLKEIEPEFTKVANQKKMKDKKVEAAKAS